MTLEELIVWADKMKPDNRFAAEDKTLWLNTVEAMVQQEGLLMAPEVQYEYETDRQTPLLLLPPHDEIYRYYLLAQLSFANEEYDRYQNEIEMFNKAWDKFLLWVCTRIKPAYKCKVCLPLVWHIVRGETVTLSFFDLPVVEAEVKSAAISIWQKGSAILSYDKTALSWSGNCMSLEIPQEDSIKLSTGQAKINLVIVNSENQRFEQYPANRISIAETTEGSVI